MAGALPLEATERIQHLSIDLNLNKNKTNKRFSRHYLFLTTRRAALSQAVFDHFEDDSRFKLEELRFGGSDYLAEMANSLFCLAPSGHGWGTRATQAVILGCVPVVIQVGDVSSDVNSTIRVPNLHLFVCNKRLATRLGTRATQAVILGCVPVFIQVSDVSSHVSTSLGGLGLLTFFSLVKSGHGWGTYATQAVVLRCVPVCHPGR